MATQNPLSLSNLLRLSAADPFQALASAVVNAPGAVAKTVGKPLGEALSNFGPLFGGEAGFQGPIEKIAAETAPGLLNKLSKVYSGPQHTPTDLAHAYNNRYNELKGGMAEGLARVSGKLRAGSSLSDALSQERYGEELAEFLGGKLTTPKEAAETLPEWAQKLGGLAKPSEEVSKIAKKMKLTDLGDIVPEAEFHGRGWMGPDGELIGIGGKLHRDSMLDATGGKSANYPLVGGHKNLQRIGSYNNFEILSPPTDAQLQKFAKLEKVFGEATWDITDPTTKNLVATGKGVRNIRRELESNPKAAAWLKKFVGLGVGAGVAAEAAKELKAPAPPPRKIGPYASSHYNGQEEF